MPQSDRAISMQDAIHCLRARSFTTGGGTVGAELEWIVADDSDPLARPSIERLERAAVSVSRSRVTFEPGGQLELSSRPGTIADVCVSLAGDEDDLSRALAADGIRLIGIGMDPLRPEQRLVTAPRYDAMETYFDRSGPEGRRMMTGTAAIQINVDAGVDHDIERRWHLAHAMGPTMIAAFANSPMAAGHPTGFRSTRMANWWRMDPTRTWPAAHGGSARDAWAMYVMRARVMMIRREDAFVAVESPMSFAEWIDRGHELGYPTLEDLEYHATTLFPPVRARGWLEIRYIDAQASPWWRAAVGVVVALMNDPVASERALRATRPVAGLWTAAARDGMTDSRLAQSAIDCFTAALEALPRSGADDATIESAVRFFERFVLRRRSPADEVLMASGADVTEPESVQVAG